ncbi:MAG: ATP-dependent Clp protease proteolytic subunit [Clostridia bacterium]|nr:ATP-dependent Clp protease proteolytic subunit [Clostridia bacterium]
MIVTPVYVEKTSKGEVGYDLYSRLLQERIIFVFNEINDDLAQSVIAQMLLLEAQKPHEDIYLYINSPGGSVTSGMAIYDTMRHLKCDVNTICVGMAASMGAFLLAGGTKGKRFSLENSEIMIHQVLGGARGQASDVEIAARNIRRVKDKMNRLLADMTGRTQEELERDTDRDNYMDPFEAKEYGIIDHVIVD